MHRIDTDGATGGNLFTEGNPSLSIPATVVGATWLNDTVQEELVNVVLAAGITLSKPSNTQLLEAIQTLISTGGASLTSFQQTINNLAAATNLTGVVFAAASFKAAYFKFDIFRRTDSTNKKETGEAWLTYNSETATWAIEVSSHFDDSGVVLSVTAGGQVQYASDSMAGASYAGTIRIINVMKFKQTI